MKKYHKLIIFSFISLSLFTALLIIAGERKHSSEWTPLSIDIDDPGRGGAKALYLLLQCQQHNPTKMFIEDLDWNKAQYLSRTILLSTYYVRIDTRRSKEILGFVQKGGEVILIPYSRDEILKSLNIDYVEPGNILKVEPESINSSSLADSMRSIVVSRRGGRMKDVPSENQILYDSRGAILARFTEGEGSLYILADPWPLSNEALDLGDNAEFALWLFSRKGIYSPWIAFVPKLEYESLSDKLLGSKKTKQVLGILLLLLLMYLLNENVSFHKTEELNQKKERSQMEFVEALAGFYKRCKAPVIPLEQAYKRALIFLSRRTATRKITSLREILPGIPDISEAESRKLEELFASIENELKSPDYSGESQKIMRLIKELQEGILYLEQKIR